MFEFFKKNYIHFRVCFDGGLKEKRERKRFNQFYPLFVSLLVSGRRGLSLGVNLIPMPSLVVSQNNH